MLRLLLLIAAVWVAVKLYLYLRAPVRKRRPAVAPRSSAHEVLGVAPGASSDEIRRAYREKAVQYHPDRVSGLAPELQEMAERRMKEINAAYRELCRSDE